MFRQSLPIADNGLSAGKISPSMVESNWFVFYTFSRAEKVVYKELMKRRYDVFLPMTKSLSLWKNRQKKWIDLVLFSNYIFVKTQQYKIHEIIKVPRIVTCIHCSGKPSIVPDKDIDCIKKILMIEQEVIVDTKFYEGEKVKIICGPLMGYEGLLIKQNGKTRFGIQLTGINQTAIIDINARFLSKL